MHRTKHKQHFACNADSTTYGNGRRKEKKKKKLKFKWRLEVTVLAC
jgi:hypothetical protein